MFRPSIRLSFGAVLFVAAWFGAARAQAQCPSCGGASPSGEKEDKSFWYKVLHPVKSHECYTHHNSDFKCGSWRSETTFIFGSCRAFFGDPCFDGPPGDGSCPPPGHLYKNKDWR
jgi:hypothetical protein